MDVMNMLMNMVAPPATFFALLIFLPLYLFFRFMLSVLRTIFSEKVAGKVVLITGASSGIGEQLAYQYAKRGACLSLVARRENRLREVAERAREYGSPDTLVICADVSKKEDCKRFVDETIEHFGRLDHLVNNAGIAQACLFEESADPDNFRQIMDINFWGTVYPTYFAVPQLRKNKGKIITLGSAGGWLSSPRMSFYNASKAALINFSEVLRVEFGSDIGITIVNPGFIESELTQGKFVTKDGEMEVDEDLRDIQVGTVPVAYAEGCARAIVNSVCRGDRYLTQPFWYNVTFYVKAFCPEMLEWFFRIAQLYPTPGTSDRKPLSKKILDVTGAKRVLYPSSIRSDEAKASEVKVD